MSDEKEISKVRQNEIRTASGKPPLDHTSREEKARIKNALLRAIRENNEAEFIAAILDLGHNVGSDEYVRIMKIWNERPAGRRLRDAFQMPLCASRAPLREECPSASR